MVPRRMRIPYTGPLPPPVIRPATATTTEGAVTALAKFLTSPTTSGNGKTVLLTGAGISVASGLADYRGQNGTYRLNKTYRPIYYSEFCESHAARKRYWARSFLGWTTLNQSKPNAAHLAIEKIGSSRISTVITQNVDSFHNMAHPGLPTLELHGYLRSAVCLSCRNEYDRAEFQQDLARLNPAWRDFLAEIVSSGALTTEDPTERAKRGLKANPDGDVSVPGVDYTTFRYPPCPTCVSKPPPEKRVEVDSNGAWLPESTAGILKPAVIMFGESIQSPVRLAVEHAIDVSSRMLVLGSSLATYSAMRLAKRAKDQGKPISAVNVGGMRGDEEIFSALPESGDGSAGVRCSLPLEDVLPALADRLDSAVAATSSFQPAPWAHR